MMEDRTADYLKSLEPADTEFLTELRQFAKANDVPIVRIETESFLRTLCALKQPRHILEIGTAIGFSAIVMSEACDADLVTIESFEPRIPQALANFQRAGIHPELIHGDAAVVLKDLSERETRYDLVFLDAAKGQYLNWLEDILALMEPGGILIADNVLQDRTVMESRYTVERRDRTTHRRMREFLSVIKRDPRLTTSIVPVGDGVSLSVLKRD